MVKRFGSELECDVLKCGHHGSRTSTSEVFLKATNPTWAVISCGVDNSYGHPHQETLERLNNDDVQVYPAQICLEQLLQRVTERIFPGSVRKSKNQKKIKKFLEKIR